MPPPLVIGSRGRAPRGRPATSWQPYIKTTEKEKPGNFATHVSNSRSSSRRGHPESDDRARSVVEAFGYFRRDWRNARRRCVEAKISNLKLGMNYCRIVRGGNCRRTGCRAARPQTVRRASSTPIPYETPSIPSRRPHQRIIPTQVLRPYTATSGAAESNRTVSTVPGGRGRPDSIIRPFPLKLITREWRDCSLENNRSTMQGETDASRCDFLFSCTADPPKRRNTKDFPEYPRGESSNMAHEELRVPSFRMDENHGVVL